MRTLITSFIAIVLVTALGFTVWQARRQTEIRARAQNKQIKIGTFDTPKMSVNISRIWLQECKPAIYLYPEKRQAVQVRVTPKGHFMKTIPSYGSGWNVEVDPNGIIHSPEGVFRYLYYESALIRSEVSQPQAGYVVPKPQLATLFQVLLSNWQLTQGEQQDFIDYWQSTLPNSPYYFVGIVNRTDIDRLEPLTIIPQPDSLIRLRFYFKPLASPMSVPTPVLPSIGARSGFAAVEWGGIVDNGKHDFLCSQ